MKKVIKFVKGKKETQKDLPGLVQSQSRDLISPGRTPEDERFLALDTSSGYLVDFCGKDKSLTKLHKAAWQGHLDKIKTALKKTEIDVVDRHNRSALHFAVAQGHPNIVWYLLGHNAKVTICDDDGCTPLLKSIECGHKECMSLLLENGADINNADYQGNTGLHIAAKQGNLDITSTLLSRGAALDVANNCGEYPLHIATRSQNKDLVELLLTSGASVNVFDRENRTPLMLAAKMGNLLLTQLFFKNGSNLTVVDSNGWTAEDYALLGGHEIVANELKSYGQSATTKEKEEASEARNDDSRSSEAVKSDNDSEQTWNDYSSSVAAATPSEKGKDAGKRVKKLLNGIAGIRNDKEDDVSDSPDSEVMPPPCQPPRSWEIIQAGMIDLNQSGSESKRLSLTALGTLHSRRESFTDAVNTLGGEAPKYTLSLNRKRTGKRDNSFAKQRFSFNAEDSLKSLTSDLCSKLKEMEKSEADSVFKVESSEGKSVRGSGESESDWDSDCTPIVSTNDSKLNAASEPIGKLARCSEEMESADSQAFKTIDEIWVGNAQLTTVAAETKEEADDTSWDSKEASSQDEANFPPPPSGIELGVNIAKSMSCMKGKSMDHPLGSVREKNLWKISYEEEVDRRDKDTSSKAENVHEERRSGINGHARHLSISTHKWRSEEIPQSQKSADRLVDVNRRINEQLQCYDQALRELAHTPYTKKQEVIVSTLGKSSTAQNYYSLPSTKHKVRSNGQDSNKFHGDYYCEWAKPITDNSGPLSLPFSVNDVVENSHTPAARVEKEDKSTTENDSGRGVKTKRHMLLVMRDVKHAVQVTNNFKTSMDDQLLSPLTKPEDSEDSDSSPSGRDADQNFFLSDRALCGRQETVIERQELRRKSSSSGEEPTLWLQDELRNPANGDGNAHETGEKVKLSVGAEASPRGDRLFDVADEDVLPVDKYATPPGDSSSKFGDGGERQIQDAPSPDESFSSGPIEAVAGAGGGSGGKDSGSDADSTQNDVSPTHNYTLKTHHDWLKNHLKTTTTEKNKLEQHAMELSEKAERLQYELADAREATKSKDEVILILQSQLARMESAYTKSLEESVQSRLQLTSHEQEILHLKELCFRYAEDKEKPEEGEEDDRSELRSRIRLLEEEKEKLTKDIVRLEQEKVSLEKKLQEVTTCEILDQCQRWKERFENVEESAKANDEANSMYLHHLKGLREDYIEREKNLTDRNVELERRLFEAKENNAELEARLRDVKAELESEKLKFTLRKELNGSVSEISKKNTEMEAQMRRLEKEVEQKNLSVIKEKEEEIQVLLKRFSEERETLIKSYEVRLAERECDQCSRMKVLWSEENEKLKLMVKHLQEQFTALHMKNSSEETNEALRNELEILKEKCIQLEKNGNVASMMKENLTLKKEIDTLRIIMEKDNGDFSSFKEELLRITSDYEKLKSALAESKSEVKSLESSLNNERELLQAFRKKNNELEQQILEIKADSRDTQKSDTIPDARHSKKRGVGREDELAWTNLYGIKRAGRGRESSNIVCEEDNDDGFSLDRQYERSKEEVRQRLVSQLRESEEKRSRQAEQQYELLELRRQIIALQNRVAEEKLTRCGFESKLREMESELQEKQKLELEVSSLKRRIERDFVPRTEIELLKHEKLLVAQRMKPQEDGCEQPESPNYKAKCERFAREMEKFKEIRKRIENYDNDCCVGGGECLSSKPRQSEVSPTLVLRATEVDLEPEVKSRLNEELDKSIKRHLADVGKVSETEMDFFNRKFFE